MLRREPDSGPWGERDERALWLLCRTLLGCIERRCSSSATSARVSRARRRWRSHGSPSQAFGEACVRNAVRVEPRVKQAFHQVLADRAEAEAAAAEEAGEAFEPAARRGGERGEPRQVVRRRRAVVDVASRDGRAAADADALGALAAECAGALHDLRVALRNAGGEWLELGRWLGGPPLPSMGWEVQLSAGDGGSRRPPGRACASLHELAGRLRDSKYGPYGLRHAAGAGHLPLATDGKGKRGGERNDLDASSTVLLTQTQQALKALREFRRGGAQPRRAALAAGPAAAPRPRRARRVRRRRAGGAAPRAGAHADVAPDASEAVQASSDVGLRARTSTSRSRGLRRALHGDAARHRPRPGARDGRVVQARARRFRALRPPGQRRGARRGAEARRGAHGGGHQGVRARGGRA